MHVYITSLCHQTNLFSLRTYQQPGRLKSAISTHNGTRALATKFSGKTKRTNCRSNRVLKFRVVACNAVHVRRACIYMRGWTDKASIDWLHSAAVCMAESIVDMAWGNIRHKRSRRARGEPFALFIQWQWLCHTGWHCSILSFCLFQIGLTYFAVIFSANCLIYLIALIICCHPVVTLKSCLSSQKQPRILDPVTVLTVTNLSFITPS